MSGLAKFGQSNFWPIHFCVLCVVVWCRCVVQCGPPCAGPPPPDRPKFRSFFSLSRHHFVLFFLSHCVFSLNFGGFCEDQDPQMCTFGLSKRAHVRPPALPNTTKKPREDPQRETKRAKMGQETEKKKGEILGSPPVPPFGAPPFGARFFLGLGPTLWDHDKKLDWPKLDWPKLVKSGWPKRDWPKSVSSGSKVHQNT